MLRPLPLRLRKPYSRKSRKNVRAVREKTYEVLVSGHDTAIANMISQQLCLPAVGLHKTGPVKYQVMDREASVPSPSLLNC